MTPQCPGNSDNNDKNDKGNRKKKRRKELLRVAEALFGEKGFDATTIDDITQGAGISHGTFYVYFASKEEVLQHLGGDVLEEMLTFSRNMASREEYSPQERLFRIVQYLLTMHKDRPFRMNLHDALHRRVHDELVERGIGLFLPLVISLLREGVALGEMSLSSPEDTATFLVLLIVELEHSMDLWKSEDTRKRAAKALRELLVRTLGGDDHVFLESLF